MNHLTLPRGKRHILVPNLTDTEYVSQPGGFEAYPASQGWTKEHLTGYNNFGGRTVEQIQSFLQTWLYFGCAIEVLAIAKVDVKQSDFLDETGRYVSSRKLPSLIRQVRVNIRQQDEVTRVQWAMKTFVILRDVSRWVDRYCIPLSAAEKPAAKSPEDIIHPLTELTWISIIVLGHTLSESLSCALYYDIRTTKVQWGRSRLLKTCLLQNGWCPLDVERALSDLGIDAHYYMLQMQRPEPHLSHEHCTSTSCIARNVNVATYRQLHVKEDGDCGGSVNADIEKLVKIVKDGYIPVYRWFPNTKQLEVVPSIPIQKGLSNPPFIALSHVWSDGLGNEAGNAMFECRLDQLQDFVESLNSPTDSAATQAKHFWLDTLCVPVGPGPELKTLRKKCIAMMANIYRSASASLIISSTIRPVASTDSEIDQSLALFFCNWNRRLWTCQEGMLATKIWFQFSDKALDLEAIQTPFANKSVRTGHAVSFPREARISATVNFSMTRQMLEMGVFKQMGDSQARSGPFAAIIKEIQNRSTSWQSDETICLATLIDLNISRLQNVAQDIRNEWRKTDPSIPDCQRVPDEELSNRRMKLFLSMLKIFPRAIIFNGQRRLPYDGFRWAPASFLGIPQGGFLKNVEGEEAVLDKRGRGLSLSSNGMAFTLNEKSAQGPSTSLHLSVPQEGKEDLRFQISVLRSNDDIPVPSWRSGVRYGILLSKSLTSAVIDSDSNQVSQQNTQSHELERFMSALYRDAQVDFTMDAVIGPILRETSEGAGTRTIQIQHECVAKITLLNPAAFSVMTPDELLAYLMSGQPTSEWEDLDEGGDDDEEVEDEEDEKYLEVVDDSWADGSDGGKDPEYLELYRTGDYIAEDLPFSEPTIPTTPFLTDTYFFDEDTDDDEPYEAATQESIFDHKILDELALEGYQTQTVDASQKAYKGADLQATGKYYGDLDFIKWFIL